MIYFNIWCASKEYLRKFHSINWPKHYLLTIIKLMKILSSRAKIEENYLISNYTSTSSVVTSNSNDGIRVEVIDSVYQFRTDMKIPKLGLMMVGWGGNNGTTITGGILANKHNITWEDKKGIHEPNFLGSVTQASTMKIACT